MRKKLAGLLLTFIFVIGAIPVTSLAESSSPVIKSFSYVNNGKDSTFKVAFDAREDIIMASAFLIGEEVKEGENTESGTFEVNGKKYHYYAMTTLVLPDEEPTGHFSFSNCRFEEMGVVPAAGKRAGIVIGTACDGDDNLTFSNINWFTVPSKAKKDNIQLTLKKVTIKRNAKKVKLSAKLKINGKVKKGVYLYFTFNGKVYKAKTNKKGIASRNIKKSVLKKLKVGKKVTYAVSYGNKTVKRTAKVKK